MDNGLRQKKKPALVICFGAPCSGLNLLVQCLRLLGFVEPDDETAGPTHIHAMLCRDLGISTLTAGSLPHGWQDTPVAKNARQRIRILLTRHAEANDPWVLADSFLARTFPLWQDVLAELDLQPRLVHLIRHPWEVAQSLAASEILDLTQAHILWLAHVRDAQRFSQLQDYVRITFDQLLADPVTALHAGLITQSPALISESVILRPDSLLLSLVQPNLKHHHAGSASETERKRFGSFVRVYDEQRLCQAVSAYHTENASKDAMIAVSEKENVSGDDGLLEIMLQVLGRYEAKEHVQATQVNRILDDSHRVQELLATVKVPSEKDKYIEKHFMLFSDQWQKLTLDIPRPDLLTDTPLILFPLNTMGLATISTVKFVDRSTNNALWSIRTFADNRLLILKGNAIRLPSKDNLDLFITGKEAEVIFNDVSRLPDRPMRVEIWIRSSVNPAKYHEMLRAFLGRESWKAILGSDPSENDTDSLLHLAGAFEKADCPIEADVVFQKALEMHPASESRRIKLAELAMNRQSWAEAIRRWQDVAALKGQHTQEYIYQKLNEAYANQKSFPSGSPEEEVHMGDGDKHEMLSVIHRSLGPELYVEIGVQEGKSLALAQCQSIGIDPMPQVKVPLSEKAQILAITSDDFFKGPATDLLRRPPDLVFIDGMHLFDYALRDFMNVERFATAWTLVVIDDILPVHPAQAERRRRTRTWTGDVWKLVSILKKYRSDLFFLPINASPTGLLLIAGLKQDNEVLWDNYDEIVGQYAADMMPPAEVLMRDGVLTSKHVVISDILEILKNSRNLQWSTETIIRNLVEKVKQAGG